MNDTILKFGYPNNLIKEFEHWVILLRPKQVTLGSLVLACKEDAESLADVSTDAFKELKVITSELESVLKQAFNMDKINYLALMMVDKEVHFHVIPRYSNIRKWNNKVFEDSNWPKPPDFFIALDLSETEFEDLKNFLISKWNE